MPLIYLLYDSFVQKLNANIEAVKSFSKFLDSDVATIQEIIKKEKLNNPKYLPYYICFHSEPLYVWIVYITNKDKTIREFIEVTRIGYRFHDINFDKLKNLISYLKDNFRDTQYQRYLQNKRPPGGLTINDTPDDYKNALFCKDTGLGK